MNDDFKDRVLHNSVALLLIIIGVGTWFLGGKTQDAKEICVALIGSGTTYLISSTNRNNKRADTMVQTAGEVNIDDRDSKKTS